MQQFGEFIFNHWILWSLFIALSGMMVWSLVAGAVAGVKQVNATEFTRLINHQKAVVIDVRDEAAYKKGHILNALHIPASSLAERASELEKYKEGPTLLYCQTGATSLRSGKILQQKGFQQISSLQGGVGAWQEAKLPLSSS